MNNLKDSQTIKNMMTAFQGESMARNCYTFYEEQARKEGNAEVADMFAKMAKNETIHARLWFNLMNKMGNSEANIQGAAAGEHEEWKNMYPEFASTARAEGFEDIARLFERVAEIEHDHELTFLKSYMELKQKNAGKTPPAPKEKKTVYRCMFCGAVYDARPDVCSVCEAIGSFEIGESMV